MTKKEIMDIIKQYYNHYTEWATRYSDEDNEEMAKWCCSKILAVEELLCWLDIDIDKVLL